MKLNLAAGMQRLGHRQIMTTQQYLHTLPDTDRKALDAFTRIRRRSNLMADAAQPQGNSTDASCRDPSVRQELWLTEHVTVLLPELPHR